MVVRKKIDVNNFDKPGMWPQGAGYQFWTEISAWKYEQNTKNRGLMSDLSHGRKATFIQKNLIFSYRNKMFWIRN